MNSIYKIVFRSLQKERGTRILRACVIELTEPHRGTMKRQLGPHISPNEKFIDCFSYLIDFSRSELLSIAKECTRILNQECSEIVSSIPQELWYSILLVLLRKEKATRDVESLLRCCACVSYRWSSVVNEIIRDFFSTEPYFSPWILARLGSFSLTSLTLPTIPYSRRSLFIQALPNLTKLTSLEVSQLISVERGILKNLTNLTSLQICHGYHFDDIEYLTNLKILKTLAGSCNIVDETIKNLSNLTSLHLIETHLTASAIRHLTNLTYLRINPTPFLKDFKVFPNLCHLVIDKSIGNRYSSLPRSLTKLEMLRDSGFNLHVINHLPNLCELVVDCPQSSNERKISEQSLKSKTNLTSITLAAFYRGYLHESMKFLPNLTSLSIENCPVITETTLVSLVHLRVLSISSCNLITNSGLARLTNLESLSLYKGQGFGRRDDAIKCLTNLTILNIPNQNNIITNKGVKALTNLTSLDISGTSSVKDNAISKLTKLSTLNCLEHRRISFLSFKKLTNLTSLQISHFVSMSFHNFLRLSHLTSLVCYPSHLSLWQRAQLTNLKNLRILTTEDSSSYSDSDTDSDTDSDSDSNSDSNSYSYSDSDLDSDSDSYSHTF